jgi:hypothetical protein
MRKYRVIPAIVGMLAVGAWQVFGQETRATRDALSRARIVVVPAHVEWTNTLLRVGRGQLLRFESTGEILLSYDAHDVARAGGATSGRRTDKAPIPSITAGALIGRVNTGHPFSIGDYHVADNSGNLVVRIWRVSP